METHTLDRRDQYESVWFKLGHSGLETTRKYRQGQVLYANHYAWGWKSNSLCVNVVEGLQKFGLNQRNHGLQLL